MARKWEYKYEALETGERQYDDIDLATTKIVHAKYVDTYVHRGNPFIEALPFARTSDEVEKTFNNVPALPSSEVFEKFAPQIQNMLIDNVKKYRIALPFHSDVEEEFSRTLIESYASRIQTNAQFEVSVDGETFDQNVKTKAFHEGEAITGFAMLGVAGSGKTTAMNLVLDHYPQVIIHDFGEERVIQIVYLFVTCVERSNFNALYEAICMAIDEALGNGNKAIQNEINSIRVGGLGAKANKIRELIEKYSIGCIIFDEIQEIDLRSANESSIEALLRLNNTTHVGMGVLGTEEAFDALFSKDRTVRRFSAFIAAGRYCNDEKTFANIVRGIFLSQIFREFVLATNDIIQVFKDESAGVVAYVVLLYYYVLKDYNSRKEKPEVTADYIRKIGVSKRAIIHRTINRHRKSTKLSEVRRRQAIEEMNSFGETEEQIRKDEAFTEDVNHDAMFWKGNAISFLAGKYPDRKSKVITAAVDRAIGFGAEGEVEIIEKAEELLTTEKKTSETKATSDKKDFKEKIEIDVNKILEELYSSSKGVK